MMVSIMGNFSSAATPLVGSSNSNKRGAPVMAKAMSISLRRPPGNSDTKRSRCLSKLKRDNTSSARNTRAAVAAGNQVDKRFSWQANATNMFSSTVMLG